MMITIPKRHTKTPTQSVTVGFMDADPEGYPGDTFMHDIVQTLKERFSVQHSTLQVEQGITDHACVLHPVTEFSMITLIRWF